MNEKTIRCPKGPAIIFLITAISYLITVFAPALLSHITGNTQDLSPLAFFRLALWFTTALFMSIVLFSKKYNNALIVSAVVLLIPSVLGLFFNITPYLVSEIIFHLMFIAFTYIMVKKPETPIREKTVKFRFVIPAFQFVLILISTIQSIQSLYGNLIENTGTQLSDPLNLAVVLIPSILGAVAGFLPVLCDVLLVNWLADPYDTQE